MSYPLDRTFPASPEDLNWLRSDGQPIKLWLAVHNPKMVLQARLINTPASSDGVAEISFSDVSYGSPENVVPGQTVWVGTSAGAYDRGMGRVRKAPTATTLYLGSTSEIQWQDGLYLTVVDEIGLWPRQLRITGDAHFFVDYDLAYTDQHDQIAPVVCMGPHLVHILKGNQIYFNLNAELSWSLGGEIASWHWEAPGSNYLVGADTATPQVGYNGRGPYRVSCTVTGVNGRSATGYRYILLYDQIQSPIQEFTLEQCSGSYDQGGWSFGVTLYEAAEKGLIRDRALVILFAEEPYGWPSSLPGGVGGNIVALGWIAGESIEWGAKTGGQVRFSVQGPQHWLGKTEAFPVGFEDTDFADHGGGAAESWVEFQDLTVDKALWHLLNYRSTATACLDVLLTCDTRQAAALEAPLGTLWEQMTQIAENSILARPCCDRVGRLLVEIDAPYLMPAERNEIVQVMEITPEDWMERAELERSPGGERSLVEVSGVAYSQGVSEAFGGRSPGTVFRHYGSIESVENLRLSGQQQAIDLAGLIAGRRNNEFPSVKLHLAANNRLIDVAPRQCCQLAMQPEDTPRGVDLSGRRLYPRQLSLNYSAEGGFLTVEADFEPESFPLPAVKMTFPGSSGNTEEPVTPPDEPPPPDDPWNPPIPQPPVAPGSVRMLALTNEATWWTENFEATVPTWTRNGTFANAFDADVPAWDLTGNTVLVMSDKKLWKTSNFRSIAPAWSVVLDIDGLAGFENAERYLLRVRSAPSIAGRLYLLVREKVIWNDWRIWLLKSSDGGASWTKFPAFVDTGGYSMALDVGKHNGNVVYIGGLTQVYRTSDGGWTINPYIETLGADEIECHLAQSSSDNDLTLWGSDRQLYRTWRNDLGAPLLQGNGRTGVPGRIASDPDKSFPIYVLKAKDATPVLYDLMVSQAGLATGWTNLQLDLGLARSLSDVMTLSGGRRLLFADVYQGIWASEDGGKTLVHKNGNLSFSIFNPIQRVIQLRED